MAPSPLPRRATSHVIWLVVLLGIVCSAVIARADGPLRKELLGALELRDLGKLDSAIEKTLIQLDRTDLTPKDSIAIFEVLSMVYFAKGERFYDTAYAYLGQISHIGRCITTLPHDNWPKGLRFQWYELASSVDSLTCQGPAEKTTIAVMPFDNHSLGRYLEELGALGSGLAQMFLHDFAKISSLTIVERDKIDYLIKELDLAKEGNVDQASALRAGKLLQAHMMVFGSFIQLDNRSTQLVVRVVDVETSRLLASQSIEGRPDYFKLEKAIVKEVCEALDIALSKDDQRKVDQGGSADFGATGHYWRGLQYEDLLEYELAYGEFKLAHELDPDFEEAAQKMKMYRPWANLDESNTK